MTRAHHYLASSAQQTRKAELRRAPAQLAQVQVAGPQFADGLVSQLAVMQQVIRLREAVSALAVTFQRRRESLDALECME